ncbi:MAG: TOBE domain-containing protein [Holosporaceae bacterium]|nr:MAG: TOBE domain-containing protein [Holosporaceae bacterium]
MKNDVVTLSFRMIVLLLPVALPKTMQDMGPGSSAELGIRPEHLIVCDAASSLLTGRIQTVEHLGVSFMYIKAHLRRPKYFGSCSRG